MKRSTRAVLAITGTVALVSTVAAAFGAVATQNASCTPSPVVSSVAAGQRITVVCTVPNPPPRTVTATARVTVTATTTVTATPTDPTTTLSSDPTTATTATSSPPSTGFPDASTTGVPAGTTLTNYTGPCTITVVGTVLNQVNAISCGMLFIHAPGVQITNSRVPVINATDQPNTASVTLSHSDVVGGNWSDGVLWGFNITADHVNVTGGQHSFHCNDNCTLTDSYLHDQYNPTGGSSHNNAFLSNGGTNMVVRHNTLWCTPLLNNTDGGCTADVSLFGDFDPISHVTIDDNLLKANNSSISYCAYGGEAPSKPFPHANHVSFTNNVFERGANNKCGYYGPITSFDPNQPGNVWSGNVWSDGTTLASSN